MRTTENKPRRVGGEVTSGGCTMTSCSSVREQNTAVTSYYNQQTIDIAAEKPSVRLTPATIMYASITADKKTDNLRNILVNIQDQCHATWSRLI